MQTPVTRNIPTLAVRFKMLKPYLPEDTVPSSHLGIIERICSCLPEPITPSLGFELHLSKVQPRVDFVFGVTPRQNGPWLARAAGAENLPENWRQDPAWEGIRNYVREWNAPGNPLHEKGGPLWMAFDLTDPEASHLPVPCVYISPIVVPLETSTRIPEDLFVEIGKRSLELLTGPDFHEDLWQKVMDCYECLPPNGNIFQLGKMFSRKDSGLKVCVFGLSADQIVKYLEDIGWAGAKARIRPAVEWVSGITDFLCFSFSIHPHGVGSDLGVECHYHKRPQPSREPRWLAFLDGLVNQGLCSVERKGALLRWPKLYNLPRNKEIQFYRRLSWIKLKWKNDAMEAKAYLGFAKIRRKSDRAAAPEA